MQPPWTPLEQVSSYPPKYLRQLNVESYKKLAKIYDPLGLVSPITLQGKLIYREICLKKIGWDAELDQAMKKKLTRWETNVPSYVTTKRSLVKHKEEIYSI